MILGQVLAARREQLNLSQLDVANAVGISKSTISRYESGEIDNMRRDRIYALSRILCLSTKVIMNWDERFFIGFWEPDDVDDYNSLQTRDEKLQFVLQHGIDLNYLNSFFDIYCSNTFDNSERMMSSLWASSLTQSDFKLFDQIKRLSPQQKESISALIKTFVEDQ